MKVINAGSLEGMRASKEILANEIGVIFNKPGASLGEVSTTPTAKVIPTSSRSKAPSTAAPSASGPPISSGC